MTTELSSSVVGIGEGTIIYGDGHFFIVLFYLKIKTEWKHTYTIFKNKKALSWRPETHVKWSPGGPDTMIDKPLGDKGFSEIFDVVYLDSDQNLTKST